MSLRTLALSLALLAPASLAQTDSIPYDPANQVTPRHFFLLHENGDGLHAFSAFAQSFLLVAGPGTLVNASGDFGALISGGGTSLVYNARRHVTSEVPRDPGDSILTRAIGRDVAFFRMLSSSGETVIRAYSLQVGTWETLTIPPDYAVEVVFSDNVIGVHYFPDVPNPPHTIACFGARKGSWTVQGSLENVVSPLRAEGNVVAAEVISGFLRAYAFSGVHNKGALSMDVVASDELEISHNMAYTRIFDGASSWSAGAFSAYDATWVTSNHLRNFSDTQGVLVQDNYAAVFDGFATNGTGWEIIGARPHQAWVRLDVETDRIREAADALLLSDPDYKTLYAFSGVAGTDWRELDQLGPYSAGANADRYIPVVGSDQTLHAFSPALDAWSAPLMRDGGSIFISKAVYGAKSEIGTANHYFGYSPRWNEWAAGPTPPNALLGHRNDSVFALESPQEDKLWVYDSRLNRFMDSPSTSGGSILTGANVLVLEKPDSVSLYSMQRGGWETLEKPDGPIAFPLTQTVTAFDNGGWCVDADGDLVAFGSTNQIHAWHAYPEDDEYYAQSAPGAGLDAKVAFSVRGEPGDILRTYYSGQRRFTPLNLPMNFTGVSWLVLGLRISNHTIFGGTTERHFELGLPEGAPMPVQIWTQTLNQTASNLPTRFVTSPGTDPIWIF